MLIKIRKLKVNNDGYKREILFENIFVNSNSILSISDYEGINDFLLQESSDLAEEKYSLIKVVEGNKTEDIIVLGTAESVYNLINDLRKKILYG